MAIESQETTGVTGGEMPKAARAKPVKVLPTERLGFEKQLGVLRGYAAASGAERKAVSNKDVGAIVQIHENTVSICNPFFQDLGLLIKEGMKNRPSDEVADYAQAFEWDSEKAASKLAGVFRKSWFGAALIPKLTFRPLSKDEATTFLANEAKAPKEYKANLEIVLEYLRAAGVINSDGSTVTIGPNAKEPNENGGGQGNRPIDGTVAPNAGAGGMQATPVTPEQAPRMEPLIRGLIEKLPDTGSVWDLADRAKWLNAAASNFDLMYKTSENAGITLTLEASTLSIKKGAQQ
ncbi:MAG: hypothetical protein HY938_03390 [Nitrosomonadales bacterium]|nr:hypothetical protein [Nitrosomonadales bacterium]